MQAIVGLVGAVVGGFLVLTGDFVRRRAEWRRDDRRQLVDACLAFAVQFNELAGDLADARWRGSPQSDVPRIRPERHEATTQFFLTPGCEPLQPAARGMIRSCRAMYQSWNDDEEWRLAYDRYYDAVRTFEAEVRALRRSGPDRSGAG